MTIKIMIKITTPNQNNLFLWLSAKEVEHNKINVSIAISETLEQSELNKEKITEPYWHSKLEIAKDILFDATTTPSVTDILTGVIPFRSGYHTLVSDVLEDNQLISTVEILL